LVTDIEFDRAVGSHVRTLSGGKTFEASVVLINEVDTVGHFIRPKVEVGDLSGELVRIKRHETHELRRELLGKGNRVGGEGGPPFESIGERITRRRRRP
jgi:hypothetical protein